MTDPETPGTRGHDAADHPGDGADDDATRPVTAPDPVEGGAEHASDDEATRPFPFAPRSETESHDPAGREQKSEPHSITDVYAEDQPTEHLITGPEPISTDDSPTQRYDTADAVISPPLVQTRRADPPEAPRRRGNRWAGIGIGVLQAIVFAGLFYAVRFGLEMLTGGAPDVVALALDPGFIGAVGMFFIGVVIVSLLVNRAGWWSWILLALLTAAFALAGWLGGSFVAAGGELSVDGGVRFARENLLTWSSVAAFLLSREVTVWFGAWTAARGRRMAARNRKAEKAYEEQLDEAGVYTR